MAPVSVAMLMYGPLHSALLALFLALVMSTIAVENKHSTNQRMTHFKNSWPGFAARSMCHDAQQALETQASKAKEAWSDPLKF